MKLIDTLQAEGLDLRELLRSGADDPGIGGRNPKSDFKETEMP